MNYKKLTLLILLWPFIAMSQNSNKKISFRSLTIEQGLSQNSVTSISQDSLGYLWFATQDGLNKYDGNSFKIFNKQFEDVTKPTYSKLGKTYIDIEGVLWIITNSGQLEKFNEDQQTFSTVKNIKEVSTIFQSSNLDIYIGTYGQGVLKIDYKTNDTTQVFNPNFKNLNVYDIIEYDKSLLFATNESLLKIQNNSIVRTPVKNEVNKFSCLAKSKDGILWIGTFGNGLYYKSKNKNEVISYKNENFTNLPNDLIIQDVLVDSKNRLWIATYEDGVYLLDSKNEKLQHFEAQINKPDALHYNDILCLYEDYTGTMWIGTDGSGLSYYDEHLNKFNVLTNAQMPNRVNVDVVRSIAVKDKNEMWLGTSGKGLTFANVETEKFKTYTTSNSKIKSNRIMSLLFVDDDLWIGHQAEGLQIKNAENNFYDIPELSNFTIWKIYQDSNNQVWLCTRDNGLILFDKNEGIIKRFNTQNSNLTSNNIRTIEEGKQNSLWIGTEDDGLFELKGTNDEIIKIQMIQHKIKSLYFDGDKLWVGTNGKGLKSYEIKNNFVTTYDVEYGLSNNVIYAILPDNKGNLWLSSNKGISKFNPQDEYRFFTENYKKANGLQAFEFNTGAYFKDKEGMLYFGGLKGINWFDPGSITKNIAKPKTVISKFEIFGEEQLLLNNSSYSHDQNTMTFTFAGLHFSQPDQNLYRYKLLNHDENWSHPNFNNVAHYTNLPPNDYTFLVASSNYDGVWNKESTTFNFKILNPWYLTITAKIVYALLFILLIFSIYKYMKFRWHLKMQFQLEHAETERLKKLDEFKTKLYTNISHEFRTPLTLISGPIDEQLSRTELTKNDRTQFELIQRNSKRLLSLVDQLLDLSKLESGNLKLKVSNGNLSILLKQIISVFLYTANEKQIQLNSNIESMENVWFDKEVIEKVVTNLLANAVKYTPEHGYINFDAKTKDGQLIISILNNGNTLSNKDLTKLFQRFYQTNKTDDGVGIGLALVKELTILSHGNIVVNTMSDDDIQFTVTLPIEPSFYNPNEIVHESKSALTIQEPSKPKKNNTSINKSVKPLVLVVEDDSDIRQFIISILEKDYTIIQAKNGKVGVELALKEIPDLIISDIMMPLKDGIELCNDLKYDEKTSHIPIILLTAKVGEENEIIGLKTGADDYMTKPFNSEKLRIRVEKLIQIRQELRARFSESLDFKLKDLKITSVEEQFFNRLNETLELHITTPDFNAQKFAEAMLMSRMQLHRKLDALTGFSTTEFLRIQRLKLAKNLLDTSDLSISEIAYQVGFNTPSYFNKVFKNLYHCTPNAYISKRK